MFTEMITEAHKEAYLSYFDKDAKSLKVTRILYGAILTVLFAMMVFILGNKLLFLGLPVAFLIGHKYPYFNLLMQKRKQDLIVSFLFPEFLQSFAAVLTTSGNVYQALRGTLEYLKDPLLTQIEELIEKIEQGNDRQHYLDVAEYVGTSEAYMIMGRIYQFSEYGVMPEALDELQDYIQNLQENKIDELITRKVSSMDIYGLTPILISLFMTLGFAAVLIYYYLFSVFDSFTIF